MRQAISSSSKSTGCKSCPNLLYRLVTFCCDRHQIKFTALPLKKRGRVRKKYICFQKAEGQIEVNPVPKEQEPLKGLGLLLE